MEIGPLDSMARNRYTTRGCRRSVRRERKKRSMASGGPQFSIIIPLYNRVLFTSICVRALVDAADRWDETEVILVDNGSTDGTAAFLERLAPPFVAVRNTVNEGFARACNQGAATARGTYLIFLNNDTVPQPGWLTALAAAMESPAAPVVAGATLLFPDDTIQHAGLGLNARSEPVLFHYGEPFADAAIRARTVPAVTGACLMVARERFLGMGGFDEGYRNGYEDLDFCCRVRAAGGTIWLAAESVLYHFESASDGRYRSDAANAARFQAQWADWLAGDTLVREMVVAEQVPVRLTRTYATGADVRRELERVIADASAFTEEHARLRQAYDALVQAFGRQEEWGRSLEMDARRVRQRNRLQRVVGKVLRM
jgi:GT2 family glycosyltransferase